MGLSIHEMREAVRACAHIAVPEQPPPYLQRFLVLRLQQDNPDLAAKVADLDAAGWAALFNVIREFQQAARNA